MARNEVTLHEMLIGKVEALSSTTKDKMVAGNNGDYTKYREQVSRVRALQDAIDVVNEVFKGVEEE